MFHPCHHALSTPEKPAYIMARSGETVTYRQLEDRSNQGAQLLRSLGLQRGDAIALMMDNNARYFEICFAAQRSGLFFTAMSSRLATQEAEYILRDCGAKVLIVSASLAAQAADLLGCTPLLQARYVLGGELPGHMAWEAAVAAQPAERIGDESAGRDMPYSSGATGRPKGVKTELLDEAIGPANTLTNLSRHALQHRAGHGVPVARAAVPRRAAALLHDGDALRRHCHRDGALRSRKGAGADRASRSDAQPVGAGDVRAHAQARARDSCPLRLRHAEGGHPRRSAVPGGGEAADDLYKRLLRDRCWQGRAGSKL